MFLNLEMLSVFVLPLVAVGTMYDDGGVVEYERYHTIDCSGPSYYQWATNGTKCFHSGGWPHDDYATKYFCQGGNPILILYDFGDCEGNGTVVRTYKSAECVSGKYDGMTERYT